MAYQWEDYDIAKIKEFYESEIAKLSKKLTFAVSSVEDFAKLVESGFPRCVNDPINMSSSERLSMHVSKETHYFLVDNERGGRYVSIGPKLINKIDGESIKDDDYRFARDRILRNLVKISIKSLEYFKGNTMGHLERRLQTVD